MTESDVLALIDRVGLVDASRQRGVASALFTYRCSIACRHCLFGCATSRPDRVMTPEQCTQALRLLHPTGRVIHVAGGEAMAYWPVLQESLVLAYRAGVAPHFVETNCSFAVSDTVVQDRLRFLRDHGVRGVYASADPYHQEFVPAERFLRVRRIARELFGPANFYGPSTPDDDVRRYEEIARDESRLAAYVRAHPPTMVGTAADALAGYLPAVPVADAGVDTPCASVFTSSSLWELHIDPYGNLQTNCGVILGNTATVSPVAMLAADPRTVHRYVACLAESGPGGLARLAAAEHEYVAPATTPQRCHYCFQVRRFLRPYHPEVFGPAEVYD
jgi:hypothetical protein